MCLLWPLAFDTISFPVLTILLPAYSKAFYSCTQIVAPMHPHRSYSLKFRLNRTLALPFPASRSTFKFKRSDQFPFHCHKYAEPSPTKCWNSRWFQYCSYFIFSLCIKECPCTIKQQKPAVPYMMLTFSTFLTFQLVQLHPVHHLQHLLTLYHPI